MGKITLLFLGSCMALVSVAQAQYSQFHDGDLCSPNPCGTNAICRPGYDRSGRDRPVCTCPPGYLGNALHRCTPGECQGDYDCPYSRICINARCEDPCLVVGCGVNARCEARNGRAVCSCPPGYSGHPFSQCYRDPVRGKRETVKEVENAVSTDVV